jgi:cellulose synthase/poly-beta-1,6-N-acetylglucosamine synthase-like glycosyltransferase
MWTELLTVALYAACLAGLAAWGIHRLLLLYWLGRTPQPTRTDTSYTPPVLVQLPIFNEPAVVKRVIDAVAQLDWPDLRIQVLDDSTDHTVGLAGERARYWKSRGISISHVRRDGRTGFKAGALAHGMTLDDAPLICIFDADFVPEPDFLRTLAPTLVDPSIGMVQARWAHLNRNENLLTRVAALMLDGHFVIEHTARYRRGLFFNFNGTAGIWRRAAIEDAGGWAHDTITEDLDLSYRAQLRGWRFVYREDVTTPAEVPSTVRAFLTQQHRWAKGTVQTARKLLGRIIRAPLPWPTRLEAINHLTMVAAYPLVFLLALLLPPSIAARSSLGAGNLLWLDLLTILATTGSISWFYAQALSRGGHSARTRWWEIPVAMAIGVGCSAALSLAVLEGIYSDDATFERTPKKGREQRARIVPSAPLLRRALTGMMALYYLGALAWVLDHGWWSSLPFVALFTGGFLIVSISQWMEGHRAVESAEMGAVPATK